MPAMPMISAKHVRAVLCAAALCAACGDDTEGDTPSGVNPDKPAKETTASEASRVCETIVAMQSIEQECTSYASQESDSEADCIAMRDDCVSHTIEGKGDDCEGDDIKRGLDTCNGITVGDIERCLVSQVEQENDLTCAEPRGEALPLLPCVREIVTACPGLFDDDDGPTESGPGPSDGPSDGPGPGPSPGFRCDDDYKEPSGVDCDAFCTPLVATGCGSAPMMNECLFICEEAKTACPNALVSLSGCAAFEDVTWVCDEDDELDLAGGCGPELLCFGECVDMITDM